MSAFSDGLVGLDGVYDFTTLPRWLSFYDYYTVEEMQRASAITYVTTSRSDGLTVQLFTGKELEGQDQAELLRARLAEAGYDVDVIAQPDLSHAAFGSGAPGTVEALISAASG